MRSFPDAAARRGTTTQRQASSRARRPVTAPTGISSGAARPGPAVCPLPELQPHDPLDAQAVGRHAEPRPATHRPCDEPDAGRPHHRGDPSAIPIVDVGLLQLRTFRRGAPGPEPALQVEPEVGERRLPVRNPEGL